MTREQRLLRALLWKKLKNLRRGKRDIATEIRKINKIPDDEYDLSGNSIEGRLNKEAVVGMFMHEKGYTTATDVLLNEIMELLELDEDELKVLIDVEGTEVVSQVNTKKEIIDNIRNDTKEKTGSSHISWCELSGTDAEWATDERCTCPGAYVIRKCISEGMSFDDAKKWVIDNDRI